MNSNWKRLFVSILICIGLFGITAKADSRQEKVLAAGVEGTDIILYVKNPGENPRAECQIGTGGCKSVTISPISESAVPIETIFLVDNSLSVQEKYRPIIAETLSQLAANRMNGEIFSVGVFSTEITWLLENSSDYSQVKAAVDSISYQNQDTYLTDVLYELLQAETELGFRRIVIVSDGVDNKAIGYTKEELYSLIEENPCPIYTLGCTYNDNNEELKNMFALSRMTQGESWLLDDVTDAMTVVSGIGALNDTLKVTITPEESACDGTTKGIHLTLTEGDQIIQYALEMQMPFAQTAKETEQAAVPDSEEIGETMAFAQTDAAIEPVIRERERNYIPYIAGGITAIALLVLCIVVFFKKRRKNDAFQAAPDTYLADRQFPQKERETVLVGRKNEGRGQNGEERKTYLAWGREICLTDVNAPERKFKAVLNKNTILVGYNKECQICLNYEESISGQHCSISEENGRVTIRNLSKTNPTLVNGQRLEGEQLLENGDVLTLGRLKMKVSICA